MKKQMISNNQNPSGWMKRILVMMLLSGLFFLPALSQTTAKQEAAIVRLRSQVERARIAHEKQERKMEMADSLIAIGTTMREESSIEIKAASNAMKARNKEYSAQRKVLSKGLKSKSKEEVAQAKADIKKLDTEYKAELKAHDTLMRAQTKISATGTKNLDKGKSMAKDAKKAMKETSRNLTNAQYALEDATQVAEEGLEDTGKKGKKKK